MTRNAIKNEIEGYFLVLLATFFYGTAGVIGRMIYRYESDPLTVAMFQVLIAICLIFLSIMFFQQDLLKIRKQDLYFFMIYGFLGMFCTPVGFYYAIKHTTVATTVILVCTSPILVVLLSAIVFREALTRQKLLSLLLTFAGAALVIRCYHPYFFTLHLKGILFGLGTSLCLALFTLFGKLAAARHKPWTIIFYSMIFGALFLMAFRIPQGAFRIHYPLQFWFWSFLNALLPAVLADICYIGSLRHLEAGKVSIVASFRIVVASLLAFLFLGERMEILQISGAGLVLWGIILVQRRKKATLDTTTNSEMERIQRTAPKVGTERMRTLHRIEKWNE